MDRTNWQWGKKNINILMLSITYKGIAIPLFWSLLDKKGNSNTSERIALMERFIIQLGFVGRIRQVSGNMKKNLLRLKNTGKKR